MAGFLRRKAKTPEVKSPPTISSPAVLGSTAAPPPLFARFAKTAQPTNNEQLQYGQRMVSGPMSLQPAATRSPSNGKYGYSTGSLATGSGSGGWDGDMDRRRNMGPSPPPPSQPMNYSRPTPPPTGMARPMSKVSLDKPLPPAIPSADDDLSLSGRRGPGRPSLDLQGRPSAVDYQKKALPRPESAQSLYQTPTTSPTTSPVRNSPTRGGQGPPSPVANRRAQNTPPSPERMRYEQSPTSYDQPQDSPPPPPPSKSYPNMNNSNNSNQRISVLGTPYSDRLADLAPEVALFQEYSQTIPSQPNSMNRRSVNGMGTGAGGSRLSVHGEFGLRPPGSPTRALPAVPTGTPSPPPSRFSPPPPTTSPTRVSPPGMQPPPPGATRFSPPPPTGASTAASLGFPAFGSPPPQQLGSPPRSTGPSRSPPAVGPSTYVPPNLGNSNSINGVNGPGRPQFNGSNPNVNMLASPPNHSMPNGGPPNPNGPPNAPGFPQRSTSRATSPPLPPGAAQPNPNMNGFPGLFNPNPNQARPPGPMSLGQFVQRQQEQQPNLNQGRPIPGPGQGPMAQYMQNQQQYQQQQPSSAPPPQSFQPQQPQRNMPTKQQSLPPQHFGMRDDPLRVQMGSPPPPNQNQMGLSGQGYGQPQPMMGGGRSQPMMMTGNGQPMGHMPRSMSMNSHGQMQGVGAGGGGGLKKSPSMQAGPTRGKPRIFAAMEASASDEAMTNGFAPQGPPPTLDDAPPNPTIPTSMQSERRRVAQMSTMSEETTTSGFMTPKSQFEGLPPMSSQSPPPVPALPRTQTPLQTSGPPQLLPQLPPPDTDAFMNFDGPLFGLGMGGVSPPKQSQQQPTRTPSRSQQTGPSMASSASASTTTLASGSTLTRQESSSTGFTSNNPSMASFTRPRANSRSDEPKPSLNHSNSLLQAQQTPPRNRKLSKVRSPPSTADGPPPPSNHLQPSVSNGIVGNGSVPPSPEAHRTGHKIVKARPTTPGQATQAQAQVEESVSLDEDTKRKAGLELDDDPFARVEGVKMLKPAPIAPSTSGSSANTTNGASANATTLPSSLSSDINLAKALDAHLNFNANVGSNGSISKRPTRAPPTIPPGFFVQDLSPPKPVTIHQIFNESTGRVLACLLDFLSFFEWCTLLGLSKDLRVSFVKTPPLREAVLERFLRTVGYAKWGFEEKEPLSLSLQDLSDYMRGVSIPPHEYARVAEMYVHSLKVHPNHRDPSLQETVRNYTASTRAYTRVLLRLRAQAEKEAAAHSAMRAQMQNQDTTPPMPPLPPSKSGFSPTGGIAFPTSPPNGGPGSYGRSASRVSSRAPSPTYSNYSHGHSSGNNLTLPGAAQPNTNSSSRTSLTFRSPLFKLRRAPLLRVFVPSPEGDWLSDKSVLECEAECKRAGVLQLMRYGDVVWDIAVGDEGNAGRLVWDGSYLIDLDYTYSTIGELPKYLPALAFPPSYFHRVIRTGPSSANPVAHIDLSPWGEEIALNLQLLQDRVRTETPQGAYHNVMRWVHRSSFTIRPPRNQQQRYTQTSPTPNGRPPVPPGPPRIPIPDTQLFVDPGWYGTIVVETEGTNEALADFKDRCGPGAFPPTARGLQNPPNPAVVENRKVFRILREKSRPGEIWIRAVSFKERLL